MVIAYSVSALFLTLSVFLVFGWPILWAGPGRRVTALTGPESRFLCGVTAAIVMAVLTVPMASSALISGGEAVQTMRSDLETMDFAL